MAHSLEKLKKNLDVSAIIAAGKAGISPESLGEKSVECPSHGTYISTGAKYLGKREVWTRCKDCDEAELAAERQAEANRIAEAQRAQLEYMIAESMIPRRFIGRSFDNYNAATDAQKAAKTIASDYAESFKEHHKRGTGLIFSGLPGTGKSHLAAAILQGIIPQYNGMYITCMSLIRAVRNTWRKDSDTSETEVLGTLAKVPLLVIDEIGVQYGTDGEQTILFDVLDRRYRDMMPTILLTNQAKQGFKEFIGDRSFDRLVENSKWVAFDWDSYRATAWKEAA